MYSLRCEFIRFAFHLLHLLFDYNECSLHVLLMLAVQSFVEVCMKYDKKVEAEKYLKLVTPEHRAKALIKMG